MSFWTVLFGGGVRIFDDLKRDNLKAFETERCKFLSLSGLYETGSAEQLSHILRKKNFNDSISLERMSV